MLPSMLQHFPILQQINASYIKFCIEFPLDHMPDIKTMNRILQIQITIILLTVETQQFKAFATVL